MARPMNLQKHPESVDEDYEDTYAQEKAFQRTQGLRKDGV